MNRCYSGQHRFYVGVDLHARTMFTHVLDHTGQTVFEQDLPTNPEVFLNAIAPSGGSSTPLCVTGPSARSGF